MAGVKCSAAIPFELVAGEQMLLMQCSIEWGDPYTHTQGGLGGGGGGGYIILPTYAIAAPGSRMKCEETKRKMGRSIKATTWRIFIFGCANQSKE